MTIRTFRVGDVVYQRPETKRGGLPRQIDLGTGPWVVMAFRDGLAMLSPEGEEPYRAASGTWVFPTGAAADPTVLILAEEFVARELMA